MGGRGESTPTYHNLLGDPVGLHQLGGLKELKVEMTHIRKAVHPVVVGQAHPSHLPPQGALETRGGEELKIQNGFKKIEL